MTDAIRNTIATFDFGYVFTPGDFPVDPRKQATVNRILNNMVAAGQIRRISKGRFYKPKITEFGEQKPDTYQIVKDLLEKNGEIVGYLTGYTVFNELGLTTQIPAALQIGVPGEKKAIRRDYYRITFVKQQNPITKENIPLLQLLDCLRFFKNIPDSMPDERCRRLLMLLKGLSAKEREAIKQLSLKYTPQATALLGAMLETLNPKEDTTAMFNALNPQTFYKLGISDSVLPTQQKWNIK
jgi:DNA-binding MarR family transcriptional regulator